jgi:cell division protein FtsL
MIFFLPGKCRTPRECVTIQKLESSMPAAFSAPFFMMPVVLLMLFVVYHMVPLVLLMMVVLMIVVPIFHHGRTLFSQAQIRHRCYEQEEQCRRQKN